MTRPQNHTQVYVGLPIPIARARTWLDQLAASSWPASHWTAPDRALLTVFYLGSVPVRDMAAVEESVGRAAASVGAFELTPRSLESLPADGSAARQVALVTNSPTALMELRQRLTSRLARGRSRRHEEFEPRVPLLRFHTPQPGLTFRSDVSSQALRVDRILLLETRLGTTGAFPHVISEVELSNRRRSP